MSKPTRSSASRGKADQTQAAIIAALRSIGCGVVVTSGIGRGFPDLIVCRHRQLWLLEAKSATGRLRESQRQFQRDWPGDVHVVRTPQQAVELVLGGPR